MNDNKKNIQRGEDEISSAIFVMLLIFGGMYLYKSLTAPKNLTEIDRMYAKERFNKEPYTSEEDIAACSNDSGNCYSVVGTIYHEFDDDGTEHKYVEQIDFDNGGYLVFDSAPLPGDGIDQKGRNWSFEQ